MTERTFMYGPTSETGNAECVIEAFGTEEVLGCGDTIVVADDPASSPRRSQERRDRKVMSR